MEKKLELELRSRIKEQAETIERLGTMVKASNGAANRATERVEHYNTVLSEICVLLLGDAEVLDEIRDLVEEFK